MRLTASGLLFLTAAFPFVIPLVPTTDTQPTFVLLVVAFAALAAAASFDRSVTLRKSEVALAGATVSGGLLWLSFSFLANDFAVGSINRVVSFVMLLLGIATGLLNRHIFTAARLSLALKVYALFTVLFFATRGAVESLVIRSRDAAALSQLTSSGRGASTLSPEPSFFAFQIFTLFLVARLTIWPQLSVRARHMLQLMTILLLLASLGGYGLLYAAVVVLLSGWRYIVGGAAVGLAGVVALLRIVDIDSLRFFQLFTTLLGDLTNERSAGVSDLSTLGRLNSLIDYLQVFGQKPIFGDAFALYSGGGLVSLLAGVGVFGLALNLLFLIAILSSKIEVRLRFGLIAWFGLQFISGPVGLPLVGILIGLVVAASPLGRLLDAARVARSRAAQPRLI